jgi:tetratricopeptide (TPR) repeat protein
MQRLTDAACLLLALAALLLPAAAFASRDGNTLFEQGRELYAQGDLKAAVGVFEALVRREPLVSDYHLWLGRAYGRLAQRAGWMDAIGLALKTRHSLERAVELDDRNVAALDDLRQYYLRAPAFLGGDPAKAAALAQRVARLKADDDSGSATRQRMVGPG